MTGQPTGKSEERRFVTRSPEETIELGRTLAGELRPPAVILLIGELGAGKTTLTKGLAAGLGAATEEDVTSPTFTLVHEYGAARKTASVYHIDLYRIESSKDLGTLGLEDLVSDEHSIVIIEWGEKLGSAFRNPWPGSTVMEVDFAGLGETQREIRVRLREAEGKARGFAESSHKKS